MIVLISGMTVLISGHNRSSEKNNGKLAVFKKRHQSSALTLGELLDR